MLSSRSFLRRGLILAMTVVAIVGAGAGTARSSAASAALAAKPDFELTTNRGCGRAKAIFEEGEGIEVTLKFNRKMNHGNDMAGLSVCVPGTKDYIVLERYIHLDVNPTITFRYTPPISTIGVYWLRLDVTGTAAILGMLYCDFTVLPKVRCLMKTERGCGKEAAYFAGERMKFEGYAAHDADKLELMIPDRPGGQAKVVYTWPNVKVSTQPTVYRDTPSSPGAYPAITRVWFRDAYYDVPCEFTVKASGVPQVTTLSASDITPSAAVLESVVDAGGKETEAYFTCVDYPSSPNYFGVTPVTKVPATATGKKVKITLTGLKPATTYNYRADARNSAGKTEGGKKSFTTTSIKAGTASWVSLVPAAALPVAVTNAATNIGATSADLNSYIDPKGGNSEICFSCCAKTSADPGYFPTTSWSRVTTTGPSLHGLVITGLKPGTQYSFAVRVRNSKGETTGKCLTFQTGHEKIK